LPIAGGNAGADASAGAAQAGAAGADQGNCDPFLLWQAITRWAGAVSCDLVDPPPEGDMVDRLHGAVTLDEQGRVVDNTGLTGADKQAWLDALADQRWPCIAGSTFGYSCKPIQR
jgi:hypothetical protein